MVDNRVSIFSFFYNQAPYVKKRIDSIIKQNIYVGEVFLIDDNSKDRTFSEIIENVAQLPITIRDKIQIIRFDSSSGYAGGRWYLLDRASFPYIWIAEGDDTSSNNFLASSVGKLEGNQDCSFSWTQSYLIDENSHVLGLDVNHHNLPHGTQFTMNEGAVGGRAFIVQEMSHYNPFPNVSSCVFRSSAINRALNHYGSVIMSTRFASDWILYLTLLQSGNVYIIPEPLNYFRRRIDSVSQSFGALDHYWEYVGAQNFALNLCQVQQNEYGVLTRQFIEKHNLAINLGVRNMIPNE